jgi:hypothetical protein
MNWIVRLFRTAPKKRGDFIQEIQEVINDMRYARFSMWTHDRGMVDMPELYDWSRRLMAAMEALDQELKPDEKPELKLTVDTSALESAFNAATKANNQTQEPI